MEFAQIGDFCPNEICPEYGKIQSDQQRNIKKAGKTKKGRQRIGPTYHHGARARLYRQ